MEDNIIIESPAEKKVPNEPEVHNQDSETASASVFDITPDLNISLVKENENADAAVATTPKVLPVQPSSNSFAAGQPASFQAEKENLNKNRPENPLTKTISTPNKIYFEKSEDRVHFSEENIFKKPTDESKKVPLVQDQNIKAMRTYESDFAAAMSQKNASKVSMAIAESSKKEGVKSIKSSEKPISAPSHFFRNTLYIILSIVIIGGGIYGSYYLYTQSPLGKSRSATPPSSTKKISAGIIPSEEQVIVNIDNLNAATIKDRLQTEIDKPQSFNTIKEIIPVKSQNGEIFRVSAPEMIKIMGINAPGILTRSMDTQWMLGSYSAKDGSVNVFIIATNNFFQNAFAGILQWEASMSADLKQFLLTSDGSDTTRGRFIDRIIKNKDVREFISENGEMLFLYSFVSNDKIVITDNETVLSEIITRLDKKAFIR